MSNDILMPALSPTMEEGALARWHVKPGDEVKAGDIIADIETDKATMEVEAVDEGVIGELLVEAGAQNVKVGTPIARLQGANDAQAPKAAPAPKAEAAPEAKPAPPAASGDPEKKPPEDAKPKPEGEGPAAVVAESSRA